MEKGWRRFGNSTIQKERKGKKGIDLARARVCVRVCVCTCVTRVFRIYLLGVWDIRTRIRLMSRMALSLHCRVNLISFTFRER